MTDGEVYGPLWMQQRREVTRVLLMQGYEYQKLYNDSPPFRLGLEMLIEQLPMFVAGIARQAIAEGDKYEKQVTMLRRGGLVDPEPVGRSGLVRVPVAGDNLDVVEGQANGEGQGIGFDDADLGAVEPGVRGEGATAAPVLTEGREDGDDEE